MAIQMSQENYDQQQRELKELEEQLKDVNQQLRKALDFGDLSENAEYESAKREKERIEGLISEKSASLNTATIVDLEELLKDGLKVMIGTDVEVEDERGKIMQLSLVGTTSTNSLAGAISNESPVGEALLGHVEGETVEYLTPAGRVRKLIIRKISVPRSEAAE